MWGSILLSASPPPMTPNPRPRRHGIHLQVEGGRRWRGTAECGSRWGNNRDLSECGRVRRRPSHGCRRTLRRGRKLPAPMGTPTRTVAGEGRPMLTAVVPERPNSANAPKYSHRPAETKRPPPMSCSPLKTQQRSQGKAEGIAAPRSASVRLPPRPRAQSPLAKRMPNPRPGHPSTHIARP